MAKKPQLASTCLWLLRHGEPETTARGRCYGSLDVGLSAKGLRQAEVVATRLSREPLAAIYASPRSRALTCAAVIARGHGLEVQILQEFEEMRFGDYEGLPYREIEQRDPAFYAKWMASPTEVKFPSGESFTEMKERVVEAARRLREKHRAETIAIVSHGGVNRILLAEALSLPWDNMFRIAQRYGAVNAIRFIEGVPVVEVVNQ